MEKRYQVFVSSTYEDLQQERQGVMHALLQLECMPSGMELFPAANEDQWTIIRKVIDECDYYVVIVGGKYGSIDPTTGLSYTEREYRYALEEHKPIIAFLHKDPQSLPAKLTEADPDIRQKLENFRALCLDKRLCRFWTSAADLSLNVTQGIVNLKNNNPAVGWIRADAIPEDAAREMIRLRGIIDNLEGALEAASTSQPPAGSETLAGGDDKIEVNWHFRRERWFTTTLSWNDIFRAISPILIVEGTERKMEQQLIQRLVEEERDEIPTGYIYGDISPETFHTIKIQLRALGLITLSNKQRSLKDRETYWKLTPYGDALMSQLLAIRRPSDKQEGR